MTKGEEHARKCIVHGPHSALDCVPAPEPPRELPLLRPLTLRDQARRIGAEVVSREMLRGLMKDSGDLRTALQTMRDAEMALGMFEQDFLPKRRQWCARRRLLLIRRALHNYAANP